MVSFDLKIANWIKISLQLIKNDLSSRLRNLPKFYRNKCNIFNQRKNFLWIQTPFINSYCRFQIFSYFKYFPH